MRRLHPGDFISGLFIIFPASLAGKVAPLMANCHWMNMAAAHGIPSRKGRRKMAEARAANLGFFFRERKKEKVMTRPESTKKRVTDQPPPLKSDEQRLLHAPIQNSVETHQRRLKGLKLATSG